MADYPALPLWTDAFLGDTLHLSAEEVGCYLLLLMVAWRTPDNSLPDRDEDLARYCRVSLKKWRSRIRPRLEPFFTIDKKRSTWRQKRLDAERKYVSRKSERGKTAAEARWLKEKETDDADASDEQMQNGMRTPCKVDTPTPTPIPIPINQKTLSPNGESRSDDLALDEPPAFLDRSEVGKAVAAWNDFAEKHGVAKVQRITEERRTKLRQRLKECGGLDGWAVALGKVEGAGWMFGDNDRGWIVDFDFLLQKKSFTKLMEGAYDRRNGRGQSAADNRQRLRAGLAAGVAGKPTDRG